MTPRVLFPIISALLAACAGGDTKLPNFGKPLVELSSRPLPADSGVLLTWTSINSTGCNGSGGWSGQKPLNGSERVPPAPVGRTLTLSCFGARGTMSKSITFATADKPSSAPSVALTATFLTVDSGGRSTLSWSSGHVAMCEARGAWSGHRELTGRAETPPLRKTSAFILNCTGPQGAARESVVVTVSPPVRGATGLSFPSNGETTNDVRFRFTGENLIPMYPATYIWRVNVRRHAGYYTTFFWGPDGPFTGAAYYGCHPYPDIDPKPSSRSHKWELAINRDDLVRDAKGHSTQVEYDVWMTQALRVYDDGTHKVHEFYWELPDTTKVIRSVLPLEYGANPPVNAALTFGDAPWAVGGERLGGILRGLQLYAAALSLPDLLAEVAHPLGTTAGMAGIWYLNLNPVPGDISDKSGKGHHPAWVDTTHAKLWTDLISSPH
jgi:hypothetical protein